MPATKRTHGTRALRASTALLFPLLGACSVLDSGSAGDGELVANRAQTDRYFAAVVKLATPPLLDTAAPGPNGVMVIDRAAAAKIAAEQKALIADLQRQSDEVRVFYTYRLVINAVAIMAPVEMREKIRGLAGVASIDEATAIAPPREVPEPAFRNPRALEENSVKWIGASRARSALGLTGRRVSVGVIDTGVDYTHKMFGGPGTPDAYKQNGPAVVEPGTFPTKRVVRGRDFVGSEFDASSLVEAKRIPKPDDDPLDEHGHGTHVAGTIAGIGDGANTYDGVAPEAELHALKVFGRGSTTEPVVIAAMEYAADPNGDGDLSDRLDVVNLSLGSGWGTRLGLYTETVKTLTRGGTFFVAAAGNAGPERFIVGSPSTADDALSVAASTDNSRPPTAPDLLTGFSSWGPRSLDALLKPEITAPGSGIISAQMGGGAAGTAKGGTSMASPHVAGVAALLLQAHPGASPNDLKSLIMNTGLGMKDKAGVPYAISKVGAGRVQAYEAALSPLVFDPPALSFGIVPANAASSGTRTVTVKNLSNADVHAGLTWRASNGLSLRGPSALDVPAGRSVTLPIEFTIDVSRSTDREVEVEGQAIVSVPARPNAPAQTLQVPALGVATRGSEIAVTTNAPLGQGPVSLALSNRGPVAGEALAFNLLGRDEIGGRRSGACDLSSAGYRIVRDTSAGRPRDLLQFGFNLASATSTWNFCELSVQIDADGDGVADQEIAGTFDSDLRAKPAPGAPAVSPFGSFLVDAPAMRTVRAKIERGEATSADYLASVLDDQPFTRFAHSTMAYTSTDLSKVKRTASGKIRIKVGLLPASAGAVVDDFLGEGNWIEIDPARVPFTGMAAQVSASPNASSTVELKSAGGEHGLVVYLPQNSQVAGRAVLVEASGKTSVLP